MSVKFNEDGFTIEVQGFGNPIESWLETQNELLDALQMEGEAMLSHRYYFIELLRSMQPDEETASRMMLKPGYTRFLKNKKEETIEA